MCFEIIFEDTKNKVECHKEKQEEKIKGLATAAGSVQKTMRTIAVS